MAPTSALDWETKVDTTGSCTLRSLAHHSHDQTLSYGF